MDLNQQIKYLQSIQTELVEHFNELQNNWPDCYAEDHPMAQSIEALDRFIDEVNPQSNPNTNPHCPFCFIPMNSLKSYVSEVSGDQIIRELQCNQCECEVRIVESI